MGRHSFLFLGHSNSEKKIKLEITQPSKQAPLLQLFFFYSENQFCYVAQMLRGLSDSPASASQAAGIIYTTLCTCHHPGLGTAYHLNSSKNYPQATNEQNRHH